LVLSKLWSYAEQVTTTPGATTGRRERKKAATRKAIADAALQLFLERGYDAVTVRQVAEHADVSATTLLNYFPSKESLVFDRDADVEASLVNAVTERAPLTSPLEALRAHLKERAVRAGTAQGAAQFRALVRSAPSLLDYQRDMWVRHQAALAAAIADAGDRPADDLSCGLVALFALQTFTSALASDDPAKTVDLGFDIIERGWPGAVGRT
jgi:AcrR family transcriptional regulator